MTKWKYSEFRVTLSDDDKDDSAIAEFLLETFPGMKRKAILAQLVDCYKKVVETVGSPDNLDGKQLPGVQEIIGMLQRIQVVAATGGDVEEEIEKVKDGFNFPQEDFFGDE
jgi:methyl coenzyme M reductase subunit C-like uncharacterized protein (methanogenesis marker protein 7)